MVRSIKAALRLGIPALTCACLALAPHSLSAAPTPHIAYSTYFPGSVRAVAVDSVGNAYVMGGREDVFVAKLDRAGALLWWFTFGGSGFEEGKGVAVDAAGSAYVAGITRSPDFPRVSPLQPPLQEGDEDAFLVKIDPSGSRLLFASNLGGSAEDEGVGVAVDPAGHVYLTGTTRSADFPVAAAFDPELAGPTDAFVMKLRPDLTGFVYSTYLGGEGRHEAASALATDASGEVTVAGYTNSTDYPLVEAIQTKLHGSANFVTRLSSSGDSLVFSTFFGCGLADIAGIASDAAGNVTFAGGSPLSPPSTDPWDPTNACDGDIHHLGAYMSRITRAGRLAPSAGIPGYDAWATGVAVDPSGSSFVVGHLDKPLLNPGCQDGAAEAFIVKSDPEGTRLDFGTCLGGTGWDAAVGVAADREGNLVVIGWGSSPDFPLVNAFHPTPSGSWVTRIVFNEPPDCAAATASPGTLWPPNGKLVPVRVQGIEDPDGDPVTVTFTGVRQDEPLTRPGAPDATGVGTGTLLLRADRAGKGDGRVYHVAFEARDPLGASCTGEVAVCVPHDSRKGAGCGDGGAVFDSSFGG